MYHQISTLANCGEIKNEIDERINAIEHILKYTNVFEHCEQEIIVITTEDNISPADIL